MVRSYLRDEWFTPTDEGLPILDASTDEVVARWSEQSLDVPAMYDHARQVGGPALRALTFTERAAILKQLAGYLNDRRESSYYPLSLATGATLFDSRFDVDGGIGVLFAYSSRGRRELPDSTVYLDGPVEQLSKDGSFVAQHIYTPRHGLALFINAFNFPVWGMLEKFAPAFLAGIPVVVKPAEQTGYLTEKVFADMVESGLLPPGAISLACAGTDGLLDHLTSQDVLAFTGSASTAEQLRKHPVVVARAVRFTAEADSLNCAVLGPDALPGEPEFDLFIKELGRELTVKAGQKCTAIRRALVPAGQVDAVVQALDARLAKVVVGDPRVEGTTMGALATLEQRAEFEANLAKLTAVADIAIGGPESAASKALPATGAFVAPTVLVAREATAGTGARGRGVRPAGHHHRLLRRRRCGPAGRARLRVAGRLGVLLRSGLRPDRGARCGRPARPADRDRPGRRPDLHRARFAAADAGARRPGPGRRRRGTGRPARRAALPAAHRGAGLATGAVGGHRPLGGRRADRDRRACTRSAGTWRSWPSARCCTPTATP